MRLRTCTGLLLLMAGGCQHLPEGVKIDLENRVVEVGPCRCALPPKPASPPVSPPAQAPTPAEPKPDESASPPPQPDDGRG